MKTCVLCLKPIRRRGWQRLFPLPIHTGKDATDCAAYYDARGRRIGL